MNRVDLIQRLSEMPGEIAKAEVELIGRQRVVLQAKQELERKETALLLNPEAINGKNAEVRQAQLRQATEAEQRRVDSAEEQVALQRVTVAQLRGEFEALKAIAQLLGREAA